MLYSDRPILQEVEECQNMMTDCNYLKVDIDALVVDLDIDNSNREQLRTTLKNFEKWLFGGGLGKLKYSKPAYIKIKLGVVLHKGTYYNLLKAFEGF